MKNITDEMHTQQEYWSMKAKIKKLLLVGFVMIALSVITHLYNGSLYFPLALAVVGTSLSILATRLALKLPDESQK